MTTSVCPGQNSWPAQFGLDCEPFRITRHGRTVNVRNAPSPAATSSLAIADHIIDGLDLG